MANFILTFNSSIIIVFMEPDMTSFAPTTQHLTKEHLSATSCLK